MQLLYWKTYTFCCKASLQKKSAKLSLLWFKLNLFKYVIHFCNYFNSIQKYVIEIFNKINLTTFAIYIKMFSTFRWVVCFLVCVIFILYKYFICLTKILSLEILWNILNHFKNIDFYNLPLDTCPVFILCLL